MLGEGISQEEESVGARKAGFSHRTQPRRGLSEACWAYGLNYGIKFKVTRGLCNVLKSTVYKSLHSITNSPVDSSSFPVFGFYLESSFMTSVAGNRSLGHSRLSRSCDANVKGKGAKSGVSG